MAKRPGPIFHWPPSFANSITIGIAMTERALIDGCDFLEIIRLQGRQILIGTLVSRPDSVLSTSPLRRSQT